MLCTMGMGTHFEICLGPQNARASPVFCLCHSMKTVKNNNTYVFLTLLIKAVSTVCVSDAKQWQLYKESYSFSTDGIAEIKQST